MKWKKLLCLAAAALMLVGIFGGCGKKNDSSSGGDSSYTASADEGIFSKEKVNWYDDAGDVRYKIVRPEGDDSKLTAISTYLFKQVKTELGNLKNIMDSEDGTDAYEILVGDTNREETAKAKTYLKNKTGRRYDDYIIATIGKKIVIYSQSVDKLQTAAEYFAANFLKKEGIDGGIEYVCEAAGEYTEATVNGTLAGLFTIVRPSYNFSYLAQAEINNMVDELLKVSGYKLEVKKDGDFAESEYEIVVGDTNRGDTAATTNPDEYIIKINGKKIYLNGGSPHAVAMAVSEFAKLIEKGNVEDSMSVTGSYSTTISGYDLSKTYTLQWYDDFNGSEVDSTKWYIMEGGEFGRMGKNGKFSGMAKENVFLKEGMLYIIGTESDTDYRGGTVSTNGKMRYQYGYMEKSSLVPDGDGFWSLLWLCGKSGYMYMSPEIDVNECFGNASITAANCHAWPTNLGSSMGLEHTSLDGKYSNEKKFICPDGKKLSDEFHTYGFLWTDEAMTFMIDGDVFFSYQTNTTEADIDAFVNSSMYAMLSYSVGRDNNSLDISNCTPDEWQNTNKFITDWIYLYRLQDGKGNLTLN